MNDVEVVPFSSYLDTTGKSGVVLRRNRTCEAFWGEVQVCLLLTSFFRSILIISSLRLYSMMIFSHVLFPTYIVMNDV